MPESIRSVGLEGFGMILGYSPLILFEKGLKFVVLFFHLADPVSLVLDSLGFCKYLLLKDSVVP